MKMKKAAQGISSLIIFIALILVAAIAAGVIIQTSTSLQGKSLTVGKETQSKILSEIDLVDAYFQGTADGKIGKDDNLLMSLRLGPGSEPIQIEDLIVKLEGKLISQTVTETINSSSFNKYKNFNYTYLSNEGSPTVEGFIVSSDLIEFNITLDEKIDSAERFDIIILSREGTKRFYSLKTPSGFFRDKTQIFP